MRAQAVTRLTDGELLRSLAELIRQDRSITAAVLAHVAEVDARRLYAPLGYPSMHEYCVRELNLSGDAAFKRIQAARTARRLPCILRAVEDGRLHLTAVVLLSPHITHDNADELIGAATRKRKSEIRQFLAERFPQSDVPDVLAPLPGTARAGQLVPEPVQRSSEPCCVSTLNHGHCTGASAAAPPVATQSKTPSTPVCSGSHEAPSGPLAAASAAHHAAPAPSAASHASASPVAAPAYPRVTPLAPGRFALQLTISAQTQEKLAYARDLLSHALPSGDLAQVLDRALDALIAQLEAQKFAVTEAPRETPPGAANRTLSKRTIPARIRREVWIRDGGRCTFVGSNGHRCESRRFLEFDHVEPRSRGGRTTLANVRLRCRTHNQLEADRALGEGFMHRTRERARLANARARESASACATSTRASASRGSPAST